ncbi:MAG: CBS domain-containing protein [Nitrospiria bacterium]
MCETEYWVGEKNIAEMDAFHVMETNVVTFPGEASCHRVAESLFEGDYGRHPGGFGSVPIVDSQMRLIGLVSEFDILNTLLKGRDLRNTPASEIMSHPVISISEDMPVEEIVALLQSRHLIRVPVVDSEEKLIGLVARRDILGCYIESTLGSLPSF